MMNKFLITLFSGSLLLGSSLSAFKDGEENKVTYTQLKAICHTPVSGTYVHDDGMEYTVGVSGNVNWKAEWDTIEMEGEVLSFPVTHSCLGDKVWEILFDIQVLDQHLSSRHWTFTGNSIFIMLTEKERQQNNYADPTDTSRNTRMGRPLDDPSQVDREIAKGLLGGAPFYK